MNIAAITAAIALLQPRMPAQQRFEYAKILVQDPDPLIGISIVKHESDFVQSARGGLDNDCIGLAQRCLRFSPACREGLDTASCNAERARLQNGSEALRELVSELAQWRRYCRKTTGKRATARRILSGYAGADGHGVTCGQRKDRRGHWHDAKPSKAVREIEAIRSRLVGGLQ